MDIKRFGKKLREKRKARGLTYQELADLCHINHGYVRQLEAGSKLPSMPLLFSLCDILETSPNYLFEYAEDGDDKELLKRIYQLTPDQKKAMLCMLDAYIKFQKDL
ncbi:helix-turn-helix domain-containing protein [Enterocloster clostridioformis]|uniref:helix-turn-helix domain-containing protein n=1 Tax=Enterocloster clostridioformis TaxID=1531 RepID=UPI0011063D45|nr:helix-turn-helix transcriptional regulator [Enterocloster clostridioformis]